MRYCANCKKLTPGKPPYCNFCGRTYGVKLCPRGHKNPRIAECCSECGSMELSTPAPQRGAIRIAQLIGIGILSMLSVYLVYFAWRLLTDPNTLLRLMQVGFELGALFLLWMLTIGKKGKK